MWLWLLAGNLSALSAQETGGEGGDILPTSESEGDGGSFISMPEPRFATVRFSGITQPPTKRTPAVKGEMELDDGEGHTLRKRVLAHLHGGYSTRFPKKSFTVELCEDEWVGEQTTTVQIGSWVPQDGFVFMAFYTDFLRGMGEVGYELYRDMVADRQPVWERAGLTTWDERALHVPDGFPCAVYFGDKFYGLYVCQLRKNRKNFNQKRTLAEHVHLDGNLSDAYMFRGKITWTQFEVRNPQDLYTQKGTLYNGDSPTELMGNDSPYYNRVTDSDEVWEQKQRSAKVKGYIQAMSKYWSELNALESNGASKDLMRSELERRYDVESLLDYSVFFRVLMNGDGTLKNWQWLTYDGVKWFVFPYDLDQTFGVTLYGYPRPATLSRSVIDTGPFYWVCRYFQEDEQQRYCQLRDEGVLTAENIMRLFEDWRDRVGEEWYDMEIERWPESPCYCAPVCNKGWELSDAWELYDETPDYDKEKVYQKGDLVKLEGRLWEATATSTKGQKPFVRNSGIDSFERLEGWVSDRLSYLDELYHYEDFSNGIESTLLTDENGRPRGLFDLQGRRLTSRPERGLYIEDGKLRR